MDLLQSWLDTFAKVDALLIAQTMMELEWFRKEHFLEYQALKLLNWGSLTKYFIGFEVWMQQQYIANSGDVSLTLLPWFREASFPSREAYRKVAKLDFDIAKLAVVSGGVIKPLKLLEAMEAHAQGIGQWLKVAGMDKAALIERVLVCRQWDEAAVSVEFGAFVGYTSVRLANQLSKAFPARLRSVSFEVDHVHQIVARHVLAVSCLSTYGEIWSGQVRDIVSRAADELGAKSAAFVFMDHRGTRFHDDLARFMQAGTPAAASHVVADNVLNPGGPVFAWVWHGMANVTTWFLLEFMSQDRDDWMVVIDGVQKYFLQR